METTDQTLIIFDGVCNICEYSVKFIVENDRKAKFKFVSAQSDKGKELQRLHGVDTFKDGSVILLKNDHVYVKSGATVEIVKDLN